MENQPFTNPSDISSTNSTRANQPSIPSQTKTNLMLPVLLTLLVSGVIFGFAGYYLGKQGSQPQQYVNQNQPVATSSPETSSLQSQLSPSVSSAPKASLKTYTSSFEKLSFQYPSDWTIVQSKPESNFPDADSLSIQSPSGKVTVAWISAIDGLGGGCDDNAPVGSADGCPLYEVVEKQKVPNTNLNYVAYIITTDGIHYSPSFALQDDKGILTTSRTMGYLLFTGKNNGGVSAGLVAGSIPYGRGLTSGTKTEAQNFFSTPESVQAKNILLSATY